MKPLISMMLATKGRTAQAMRCIDRLFETTDGFNTELFIMSHPEPETMDAVKLLPKNKNIQVHYVDMRPIGCYNLAASMSKGDYLFLFDDDAWFYDNWLANAMKVFDNLPDGNGYVKIQSNNTGYWAERAILSRQFAIDHLGGVLCIPKYISQYEDVERSDRAIRAGLFFQAADSFIEHRHWVYGKAEKDATYLEGGIKHVTSDHNTYASRKRAGFPNDYEAILK